MTVKELIEQLQRLNPELPVVYDFANNREYDDVDVVTVLPHVKRLSGRTLPQAVVLL